MIIELALVNFEKTNPILQNLIYITYLAELLPFFLFLFFRNRRSKAEIRVFFLYTIFFSFFLLLSAIFLLLFNDPVHQLIVNRIFLVCEFVFLSIFYFNLLKYKFRKPIFIISSVLFLIYSIYDYIITEKGTFNFKPLIIECFFFLLVIVFYFYEKIQFNIETPIYYSPDFWISVAFLIYFSGNFFLFLFSQSMFKSPGFREQYTVIYSTVTIIKNIFLSTAIVVNSNLRVAEEESLRSININLDSFYSSGKQ